MIDTEARLKSILDKADRVERAARRRALFLTIIPIFFAALLLVYTFWQVNQATQELSQKSMQLSDTNLQLSDSNNKLVLANTQVSQAQVELKNAQVTLSDSNKQLIAVQNQLKDTNTKLETTSKELTIAKGQVIDAQKQVADLQKVLDDLKNQTEIARSFKEYKFPHGYEETLKYIETAVASQYDNRRIATLAEKIDQLRNKSIPWNPFGTTEREGFNSVTFATYVLITTNILSEANFSISNQSELMDALPVRNGDPQPGDLIFYMSGYCLFYFPDEMGNRFVIGMTPRNILPLDYNFGEIIGIRVTVLP